MNDNQALGMDLSTSFGCTHKNKSGDQELLVVYDENIVHRTLEETNEFLQECRKFMHKSVSTVKRINNVIENISHYIPDENYDTKILRIPKGVNLNINISITSTGKQTISVEEQ